MTLNKDEKRLINQYRHLFGNTGGNNIEELLSRNGINIQTNAVVTLMRVSIEGQLGMLMRLDKEGLLKEPKVACIREEEQEMNTSTSTPAVPVVPVVYANVVEALAATIQHWQRMILWAVKRDPTETVDSEVMVSAIQDEWYADHCALCQFTEGACRLCVVKPPCHNADAPEADCVSAWQVVNDVDTWGDWVHAAGRMLEVLEDLHAEHSTRSKAKK